MKLEVAEIIKNPVPRKRVSVIKTQIIRERTLLYGKRRITNAIDAVEGVREVFQYADREMVVVVSLDSKNAPLALEIVSVGNVNTSLISVREVFKHAILNNATAIICFHNHPSGDKTPSKEDYVVTKLLAEAGKILGIKLYDHIIVCETGEYFSFKEEGVF